MVLAVACLATICPPALASTNDSFVYDGEGRGPFATVEVPVFEAPTLARPSPTAFLGIKGRRTRSASLTPANEGAFPPMVKTISPTQGPITGGSRVQTEAEDTPDVTLPVQITGENLQGATAVRFGGQEAAAFEVNGSGTGIVAEPPAHEPGTVDLTVTTPEGTSAISSADKYTFGPIVEAVENPRAEGRPEGPVLAGTIVKIEGRGFVAHNASELTVKFGEVAATGVHVKSEDEIEAEATQAAPYLPETVHVTVTSLLGRSAPSEADQYTFGPRVDDLEPDEGPTTGATRVKIKGSGFVEDPTQDVVAFGAVHANGVVFHSEDEIEVTSPPRTGGSTPHVTVTTPNGQSAIAEQDRFFYGPLVTSIAPHASPTAGGNTVDIEGHGFNEVEEVQFGAVAAPTYNVVSRQEIHAQAPEHPVGTVQVSVRTHKGTSTPSSVGAAEYTFGLPYVERVEPNRGGARAGTEIKIAGRNFEPNSEVNFELGTNTSLRAPTVRFISPEEIEATAPLLGGPQVSATGAAVRVTNQLGTSPSTESDLFHFTEQETEEPRVTNVTPGEGPIAGGTRVRITGYNFVPGAEVRFGNTPASSAVMLSQSIKANGAHPNEIVATSPGEVPPGTVDVTVTTPEGTSTRGPADDFTYSSFGIQAHGFEVSACKLTTCGYLGSLEEFFTQASGQPPYLAVSIPISSQEPNPRDAMGFKAPAGILKNVRLDMPAGMAINPQALPRCPLAVFRSAAEHCPPASQVGAASLTFVLTGEDSSSAAAVYNVEPPRGIPAELAFSTQVFGNVFIDGGVSWHREAEVERAGLATGDYHEYAKVTEAPDKGVPLVSEKLTFDGDASGDGFVTLPSTCSKSLAFRVQVESYGQAEDPGSHFGVTPQMAEVAEAAASSPTGVEGCEKVPFKPAITVVPETGVSDRTDGATVEVTVPHNSEPASADPRRITVALPEGMTFNPAASNGLGACSDEQFGVREEGGALVVQGSGRVTAEGAQQVEEPPPPPRCPESAQVGTFAVESPDLPTVVCKEAGRVLAECPAESEREATRLEGPVYIAAPLSSDPESGNEYRIFLSAESRRLGVDIRLQGKVSANAETGRLSTTIETPELPFSRSILKFKGGPAAALANPLACDGAGTEGLVVPYGEEVEGKVRPEAVRQTTPFVLSGCPFSVPFAPAQSTEESTAQAGANPRFTLNIARDEGEQYLMGTRTTLPEGLSGSIASVPVLCAEAQANAGDCPAESRVGTVVTTAGSGPAPLVLGGSVYLTGPYQGAPYGLSIVVPAEHVGPYDLGRIITRAKIEIDPYTARVTTTSSLPTIVDGAPIRLRSISIRLDRPGFVVNPTSCTALATESTFTGTETLPARASAFKSLSTPFEAIGCDARGFSPQFFASTSPKVSRINGTSLEVSLSPHAGNANIREVAVTLPKQLAARLTTLQQACLEAQFAADPLTCPAASRVGEATVTTPLLAGQLSGPAILVSHGGRAFPDIDFVLDGDGVRLIAASNTNIRHGLTSSTFRTLPDAPFTRFTADFPVGRNSLLSADGNPCFEDLTMPVTLVAQDGSTVKRATPISVTGCPPAVHIMTHRVERGALVLRLRASTPGRVIVHSRYLQRALQQIHTGTDAIRFRLSRFGATARAHHRRIVLVVVFEPRHGQSTQTRITLRL